MCQYKQTILDIVNDRFRIYFPDMEHDIGRVMFRKARHKWPYARIPYLFDPKFTEREMTVIKQVNLKNC